MTRDLRKILPHDLHAEMTLLGGLIRAGDTEPDKVGEVTLILRDGGDFFLPKHGLIYDGLHDLYLKRGKFDATQIVSYLTAQGVLPDVGGVDYLVELTESAAFGCLDAHAEQVGDLARRRRVMALADKLIADAATLTTPVADTIQATSDALIESAGFRARRSGLSRAEAMEAVVGQLRAGERQPGLRTGYQGLDFRTNGLKRGKLYYLAARPAMGKSALAQCIADNVTRDGVPVVMFSLEMNHDDLAIRQLSRQAKMNSRTIETIRPSDVQDLAALDMAVASAKERDADATFMFEDTPGLSLPELRIKAKRYVEALGYGLVIVDGIWLMTPPACNSRNDELGKLSQGICRLAGELNVPFLVVHQLSRANEKREDKRPMLSDLRDSGTLEQDAYGVFFIHRPNYYSRQEEQQDIEVDEAELIIAKIRGGQSGLEKLAFRKSTTTFHDLAPECPR